jgi:hypothetical protein
MSTGSIVDENGVLGIGGNDVVAKFALSKYAFVEKL